MAHKENQPTRSIRSNRLKRLTAIGSSVAVLSLGMVGVASVNPAAAAACVGTSFTDDCEYIVPAGVTKINLRVQGGGGGRNSSTYGKGAIVSGILTVTAGDQLDIVVGKKGMPSSSSDCPAMGGLPGGGTSYKGTSANGCGDGGGGYSSISKSSVLLVVAGGGGGGFNGGNAGNADGSGDNGSGGLGVGGQGATQSAGGAGGTGGAHDGLPGTSLAGGDGGYNSPCRYGGEGGGAGYYGGGGSGCVSNDAGAGGGAGSSWFDSAALTGGAYSAAPGMTSNGQVTIVPIIDSITPSAGQTTGGTSVTISGSGFNPGATVSLGGSACNVTGTTTFTSITCTTTSRAAGAVTATVTNPGSVAGTKSNAFTYVSTPDPAISSISPTSGPIAGGTPVTISGTDFDTNATVTIGGSPCNVTGTTTATSLTCTTASHAAGAATVRVTNPNEQSGVKENAFTYTSSAGVPNAPARPTVEPGDREILVKIPVNTEGPAPETYTATASPGGNSCSVAASKARAAAKSVQCMIRGLNRNTSYTVQVTAENSSGTSTSSVSSRSIKPNTTKPNVVKKLRVKGKPSASKFVVSWAKPSGKSNQPVGGYTLTVRRLGKVKILKVVKLNSSKKSYTFTRKQLIALAKKSFRVRGEYGPSRVTFVVAVRAANLAGAGKASTTRLVVKL